MAGVNGNKVAVFVLQFNLFSGDADVVRQPVLVCCDQAVTHIVWNNQVFQQLAMRLFPDVSVKTSAGFVPIYNLSILVIPLNRNL